MASSSSDQKARVYAHLAHLEGIADETRHAIAEATSYK